MERTSPYLYLAGSIRDKDERQDAIVLILEQQPATTAEAQSIITRLGHTKRNEARKRPLQLSVEPWTDEVEPSSLHSATAQLPASDAELIHLHFVPGITIRTIAADTNRSVTSVHEALTLAVRKLKAILCK